MLDFGRSCYKLKRLELRSNQLGSGGTTDDFRFLASLANCTNLELLALGDNRLVIEMIPDVIGKLTNLKTLDLSGSKMGGKIPPSLCNISMLAGLYLGNNELVDAVPACLGDLEDLRELDISGNKLESSMSY